MFFIHSKSPFLLKNICCCKCFILFRKLSISPNRALSSTICYSLSCTSALLKKLSFVFEKCIAVEAQKPNKKYILSLKTIANIIKKFQSTAITPIIKMKYFDRMLQVTWQVLTNDCVVSFQTRVLNVFLIMASGHCYLCGFSFTCHIEIFQYNSSDCFWRSAIVQNKRLLRSYLHSVGPVPDGNDLKLCLYCLRIQFGDVTIRKWDALISSHYNVLTESAG